MSRIDPQVVAGAIMTALCALIAMPVAVELLGTGDVGTLGPPWLWWAVYAVFLLALVVGGWLDELVGRTATLVLLGVLVLSGAALVLLAPEYGWIPILLVFTAALSAYHVSRPVTVGIVAFNVGVEVAATVLAGATPAGALVAGGIYLMLQTASVLVIVGMQAAEATSRRLAVAHTELAAAGAALAETSRSRERLRIARELHDLVGHQLTALALELEIATHRDDDGTHVARARGIARDLLTDVRSTVGELRDRDPDLAGALHRIAAGLPRPSVHVRVADDVRPDEDRTLAVVRCVQEVITNAVRHADARNVWIEVTATGDGGVRLHARDDGRGTRGPVVPGNGLRGLTERAAELGGTVRFGPDAGRGFAVTSELP